MPPSTTFPAMEVQAPRQTHGHDLARHLGEPLMGGNRIDLLDDGPHTLEALTTAVDAAKDHVNIECSLVGTDGPGEALAQRLIARCRSGVQVNLLCDGLGATPTSQAFDQRLRDAGITLCAHAAAPRWRLWPTPAVPLSDHRRLMVVDGRVGFIGGARLHVRVEGPLVQRLQRQFISHWQRHSTSSLPVARYHPPLPPVGTQRAALAASEAGRQHDPYYGALLAAIGSARERVWVNTASGMPPRRVMRALAQAAERGVQVHLLLPVPSGAWAPLQAGRPHHAPLLRAGVRLHERRELLRTRACVIDGIWCSVGSSPPDSRGLLHDTEAHLVVLDETFGRQLEQVFRDDVACASPIDADGWSRRPLWRRAQDTLARRVGFLL